MSRVWSAIRASRCCRVAGDPRRAATARHGLLPCGRWLERCAAARIASARCRHVRVSPISAARDGTLRTKNRSRWQVLTVRGRRFAFATLSAKGRFASYLVKSTWRILVENSRLAAGVKRPQTVRNCQRERFFVRKRGGVRFRCPPRPRPSVPSRYLTRSARRPAWTPRPRPQAPGPRLTTSPPVQPARSVRRPGASRPARTPRPARPARTPQLSPDAPAPPAPPSAPSPDAPAPPAPFALSVLPSVPACLSRILRDYLENNGHFVVRLPSIFVLPAQTYVNTYGYSRMRGV